MLSEEMRVLLLHLVFFGRSTQFALLAVVCCYGEFDLGVDYVRASAHFFLIILAARYRKDVKKSYVAFTAHQWERSSYLSLYLHVLQAFIKRDP